MPLDIAIDKEIHFPSPDYLSLGNFKRGVITLTNPSKLPKNALAQADNIMLVEDGQPATRPGVQWYGTAMPNGQPIDGFSYYDTAQGSVHLVAVAGGTVYRSLNDGVTWDTCTGVTLTAGKSVEMEQYNSFLYIANGTDVLTRYNGTLTLQAYTPLTQPAAPTIAATGLTGTSFTVYYKVSAVNLIGFSQSSNAGQISIGKPREQFDTSSNYLTLTLPAPQVSQTRYDIYFSEDNLNFYYLDSIVSSVANPQTTYVDKGVAIIIPSTIAPTTNNTQGPVAARLRSVGTRLYAVGDANYPYRIWFSSGQSPFGSFSNGYDGGYLDWQLGGKYFPVDVEDYRDGKGTNIATVWCNSADGQGCIIQMQLNITTVGSLSITSPAAYKLPGSRGTPAPRSVVNVLNDYYFFNSQAIYSLGNRANLIQILSTDEVTANIRPTVRTINPLAESQIVAEYYDAKVYISAPFNGSTTNNATMIYDTELQAWMPTAYTIGFSRFLRYTANNGVHHLLALKPGDSRLTELGTLYTASSTIQGDYGLPYQSTLVTGLYQVLKDRYGFQFTEEMQYEFSDPNDVVNIELLGIDHAKGFGTIKKAVLNVGSGQQVNKWGWDSFAWDSVNWDDVSIISTPFSETSTKRYTVVNRELNAIQWRITTASLAAYYILRSLQTWGSDTQDAHPSKWRITAST